MGLESVLTDTINVVLGAGASTTLPHDIVIDGRPVKPNLVWPNIGTPIKVTAVTANDVTFMNPSSDAHAANFYVELEHTIQRNGISGTESFWQGLDIAAAISQDLQQTYDAGAPGAQAIDLGGGGRLGIVIHDAVAPLAGNLLEVTDNAGAVDFLGVTSAGVHTDEAVEMAASAVAVAPADTVRLRSDGSSPTSSRGLQVSSQGAPYTPFYLIANDPTLTLSIFVDSTTGDDSNDGLTSLTALKTINGVYSKFPLWAFGGAKIIVNLAAGVGGTVANYPARTVISNGGSGAENTYSYRGPAMVFATIATGPTQVVGGLTVTTVGRRTRIDVAPSPAWTVNNLQKKFVRFMRAGVKVLFELPIATNTASQIFLDVDSIAGVVLAGDTLQIVTPGAQIVSDVPTLEVFILGQSGYLPTPAFWGEPPSSTFERIHIGDFPTAMNVGGLVFDRCMIDNTPFWKGGSVGHVNCIYTLGVKLSCMSTEFAVNSRPDSVSDPVNQDISIELDSFDLFLVGNPDGAGQYKCNRNMGVYNESFATRGAIHVVGPGSFFWAGDGTLEPHAVALFGSGNAGPFLWCIHGGYARIGTTAGGTPLTVGTGTGNPLRVGPNTAANLAIAYGTGVGAFEEAVGFNGNFSRVIAGTATAPTGDGSRIFVAP